jgi:mono/diheme cytochrome c family protein
LPGEPERGQILFRRYCAVCHGADGRGKGPNAPYLEEDQPRDLTDGRYVGRLSDEHLRRAIADGGQAIEGSRFMPPWGRTLSPSEIRDLVAHIRRLSAPGGAPPPPAPPAGATLASELGCTGCHRIGGLGRAPVGPDLTAEGSRAQRAWLVRFLKAPHTIRPAGYHPLSRSRMPDLRLGDEEAADLAEYLLTRREERLERWRASPDGPALAQTGRDLFRQYACRACHRRDDAGGRAGPDLSAVAQRLKPGWVWRFVQDPQAVDPLSPMPRLGLDPEAARAVTVYLFGGSAPPPETPPSAGAAARGRALFRDLGCGGCHRGEEGEAAAPVGPDLTGAGDKLKPEWLSTFLARPSVVRPWLLARMPSFRLDEAEVRALVAFLSGLKEAGPPLPGRLRFHESLSEAGVQAGRRLASKEFLSCASCHFGETRPDGPPEEWAPDLRVSAQRLHPDWIVRWLQDPQRLAPGTKMPSFFSDATSGPEDVLDGDEERQILALRDWILSLGAAPRRGSDEVDPVPR